MAALALGRSHRGVCCRVPAMMMMTTTTPIDDDRTKQQSRWHTPLFFRDFMMSWR
jgi:hypothetical protein